MSLKLSELDKEPISKRYLSLQLMKKPSTTPDRKYPHSFQPIRIDHVENDQED